MKIMKIPINGCWFLTNSRTKAYLKYAYQLFYDDDDTKTVLLILVKGIDY